MNRPSNARALKIDIETKGMKKNLTDAALLRLVANHRDEQAFEILYQRFERSAFALACRCSGSKNAAEVVLQEAMLQVWRSAKTFMDGSVRKWIFRIVVNESRRIHKRSSSRKKREDTYATTQWRYENEHSLCKEPWRELDAQPRLNAALNRLTTTDRNLAAWYFDLGLTQEIIAQKLGVGPRTVSYRLGKVLDRLRASMRHQNVEVN